MRAFSASLTVLALGVAVFAGCSSSSTSDDSAGAGTGGSSAGATSGGTGGSSAGTSGAGAGEAGAPACIFEKTDCTDCLSGSCGDEVAACQNDEINGCDQAFGSLPGCVCAGTGTSALAACEATFKKDGGDNATALANCFDQKCATACAQ